MKFNCKMLTLATMLALLAGETYAAGSHTTPCYFNGKSLNIDSGCTLEVKSGGNLLLDSGSTENNGSSVINANPVLPGGRLTLSSTLPIMTTDVTSASTIYYLPYTSQTVSIYNGTNWTKLDVGATGINFALGATNMPTTQVYDVYAANVAGTPTLCSMYWGSNTSRSSSAAGKSGTADARIVQLNGIWVNKTAIGSTDCYGGAAGTTAVAIPANQGTLLGSYYTNGSAVTAFSCKPAGASGGSNNIIGISNAYNRVQISCTERETATSFTVAATTFAAENASNSDRISWVDSLQQVPVQVDAMLVGGDATIGDCAAFGVDLDATSGTPNIVGQKCSSTSTLANEYGPLNVHEGFYPQLGLHYVQGMIAALVGGTSTFNPVATQNAITASLAY